MGRYSCGKLKKMNYRINIVEAKIFRNVKLSFPFSILKEIYNGILIPEEYIYIYNLLKNLTKSVVIIKLLYLLNYETKIYNIF